ncbi:MAG TPA: alpha/beta hydrolase, partial [Candidatus Dormibacteraeota bacterium]|nr:alpha/beta hydrolase [Candidatus Dormibacteraeota bacterium]
RDGIDIHYLEWKPDAESHEPPVVLLHGLSSNARYWERVARHLPERHIVALDQRGHGLTGSAARRPTLRDGFAMRELIRDVHELTGELSLVKPVVAGHSWGATVALELVASQPDLASALVFIDGPVRNVDHMLTWDEAKTLMQPPLPRYPSMREAIAGSKRDFLEAWDEDLERFVEARVMRNGPELILTLTAPIRLELLRGLFEARPDDLWPRVHVPAVVMVARRSMARISRSTDEGIKRLHDVAPLVTVKRMDSPHDIPLYLPADVASEIVRITTPAGAVG